MPKVYIQNRTVWVEENIPHKCLPLAPHVRPFIVSGREDIAFAIAEIERLAQHREEPAPVFYMKGNEKLFSRFAAQFKQVNAGGGLVFNPRGEVLLIFRRGFWDLPKGKAHKKESMPDAALREVKEETGVRKLEIVRPLHLPVNHRNVTYHTYYRRGKHILKTTYWYLMYCPAGSALQPQLEEDITAVEWVAPDRLPAYIHNTYGTIKDVIKMGLMQYFP